MMLGGFSCVIYVKFCNMYNMFNNSILLLLLYVVCWTNKWLWNPTYLQRESVFRLMEDSMSMTGNELRNTISGLFFDEISDDLGQQSSIGNV